MDQVLLVCCVRLLDSLGLSCMKSMRGKENCNTFKSSQRNVPGEDRQTCPQSIYCAMDATIGFPIPDIYIVCCSITFSIPNL